MKKLNWKYLSLTAGLGLSLAAAGCATEETAEDEATNVGNGQEIELAYVEWDSEVASTNVIGKVLENLGYNVTLTPLDNAVMWQAVSSGNADAMVAAWLPETHSSQLEEYGDQLVNLGVNLEGAKVGLVVPEYMDADSIADLSDEAGKSITGIEPGAGIVAATETALETYPNLSDWELKTSSSGAMAIELGQAIKNEEEIIITGWSPHWMFATYDLKYLEDPEGTFGDAETINTMARKGLEEDLPEAYQVLDQFNWTSEELEILMLAISEGEDPEDAAEAWIEENPDRVAEWTEGVTK
ncbi:glycine betaine/proline transport system substrate-binding protein [Carnobacterium alterfunditum]|uniref:Glycine betaine/proline transport system substrate-binding protein n=1 Tax=Carnobacterium alterfunditum TaxID=28230 RepID=A0A1N6GQ51_9LACT|nr:glycine betaine/proline transport system substrate-binding protein [Carnobacterium alterfunditum]